MQRSHNGACACSAHNIVTPECTIHEFTPECLNPYNYILIKIIFHSILVCNESEGLLENYNIKTIINNALEEDIVIEEDMYPNTIDCRILYFN